jgi:CheY-like chemotaxis protein
MQKILIAEDDPFLLKVYQAKMEKTGFEYQIAKNGEEVFTILETGFVPDLMLLDIMMPKKDGFTTLKELKDSEKYKHIPVIITSNLGQAEDKEKAKKLGAIDYLLKSDVGIQQIIERIKQQFQGP